MTLHTARVALHQLQYGVTTSGVKGRIAMRDWGVSGLLPTDKGLTFNFDSLMNKGCVEIEYLAGHDHCTITIHNGDMKLLGRHKSAHCTSLVDIINKVVIRP